MGNVVRVDFSHQPEPTGGRVADLDDGYTRIANELLEAVMAADLTARQMKVLMAIIRKTYGFGKKLDRITNTQISSMTGIHHTHVCTAKNEMIAMNIIVTKGREIGVNKAISEWNFDISQPSKTLADSANKTLANLANDVSPTRLNTKETIQKKERKDPPITPQGETFGAAEVLGFYQEQVGSTKCRRTAEIEIILNAGYSVEDCKLVIRWGLANWRRGGKSYANLNNLFRKTRFDGYLADADVWAQGQTDRNPAPCPHQEIIGLWNKQFSCRQIELFQWTNNRPAYRNLERVWNEKNNKGRDRDLGQIEKLFSLLAASTLTADLPNKAWLTLDWILEPRNWARCYEQITREYKQRNGLQS
ncbi:MAG: replication protein [Aeromonas hydrophila]